MTIKSYTTTIKVAKTLGEIQETLAKHKVKAILMNYDEDGEVTGVAFRVSTPFGDVPYRLPARVDKVYACIQRSKALPQRMRTREQAARIAWRNVKHWIDAQMAFIEAEQVELAEVFLPFAQGKDGMTAYERLLEKPELLMLT